MIALLDLPLMALLAAMGFTDIHYTHGQVEFGKDFIAKRVENGGTVQYSFQSKAGDISQAEWRNSVQGQLLEAVLTPLVHPNFDAGLPHQVVLVTTGDLRGNAALELTLHEQVVVPPLFVEETELARRAAKPLPTRVIAFVTQLNANPGAVTNEDVDGLQIRGADTYSRIRLPELMPLVAPAIVAQAQSAFPDAPVSQAVVLCWHLRGLNLDLALRKAALSAQIEARKTARNESA